MNSNEKVILIVGDEPLLMGLAVRLLSDSYPNILRATDGQRGVEMVERHHPHLVIVLGFQLPTRSGEDVIKAAKAKPGVKVLALSGDHRATAEERAKEAGADEFLPKPLDDVKDLTQAVGRLLPQAT